MHTQTPVSYTTINQVQTEELARQLAENLITQRDTHMSAPMHHLVICLYGTLGMGKSVFARALIRALCDNSELDVPSPTFTLVQTYDALDGTPLYHFDLYRLEDPDEIYELGWEDAISEGISIVEWPERLGTLKPARCIDIHFTGANSGDDIISSPQYENANTRHITISGVNFSSQPPIDQGFILAAGFGTRMMPLTADKPKPMVSIHGKPMLDHIIDAYHAHGVHRIVVNAHYQADRLAEHLQNWPPKAGVILSREDKILDTGGGIVQGLQYLENRDFFICNGDSYLEAPQYGYKTALQQLQDAWNPQIMDILILLQDVTTMTLTQGVGDYDIDPQGRAIRNLEKNGRYMFTSLRINRFEIFENTPKGAFSYLALLDAAERAGRLYAVVHEGQWHHISTPEDVRVVNAAQMTNHDGDA